MKIGSLLSSVLRAVLLVTCWLGLAASQSPAQGKEAPPLRADGNKPRRLFVLHSGIHTIIANPSLNFSAERLREGLVQRGVPEEDIIVMSNPFPKATWKNMFPKEAVEMYLESLSPASLITQDAYRRMHRELQKRKIGPGDEIVWIGHSAGGQLGMTVAHLAHSLDKHPDFARDVKPYRIAMVITLGTPVGANLLPEKVLLRNYYSRDDDVVRMATKTKWITSVAFGFKGELRACSPVLCETWKVRVFNGIQHNVWTREQRILDRLLAELQPRAVPAWRTAPSAGHGMALSQLLSQALDQELHISLEDPPQVKRR